MTSKTIQTNHINLHYLDSESVGQTVILMHGLTANAHAFDGLLKEGLGKNIVLFPSIYEEEAKVINTQKVIP